MTPSPGVAAWCPPPPPTREGVALTDGPESERRHERRAESEPRYASPFTVVGRVRSFRHAFSGLRFVLRSQHNAWLHAVATVLACGLAAALHLEAIEWTVLTVAVTIVWVAEAFNTGLEVLADAITEDRHPAVKVAKDVAAGAVLLAAIGAVSVGCILFGPPLWGIVVELF